MPFVRLSCSLNQMQIFFRKSFAFRYQIHTKNRICIRTFSVTHTTFPLKFINRNNFRVSDFHCSTTYFFLLPSSFLFSSLIIHTNFLFYFLKVTTGFVWRDAESLLLLFHDFFSILFYFSDSPIKLTLIYFFLLLFYVLFHLFLDNWMNLNWLLDLIFI